MTDHLFDMLPAGSIAFDDDGVIVHANEACALLCKYRKDEIEGRKLQFLCTVATKILLETHLLPLIKLQGFAEEIYLTLLTSAGQHVPVLFNARRTAYGSGMITYCVFMVVASRKKFEDELVAARRLAEKSLSENLALLKVQAELHVHEEELERQIREVNNRNHELKQFSHVITHTMKEPLRKILVFSDKLSKELSSPTVNKLVRSAEQMRAVVTGLQEFIWINEKFNRFKTVELDAIVNVCAAKLSADYPDLVLQVSVDELGMIEGDEEQLKLLVAHILVNAIKFRKGDTVTIKVSGKVLKRNTFRNVTDKYRYEDFLRLEFRDLGIGLDNQFSTLIFELFRKLDLTPGQGLGLALCKRVVENHGGYIEAEGEVNEYTKITCWLPLSQQGAT